MVWLGMPGPDQRRLTAVPGAGGLAGWVSRKAAPVQACACIHGVHQMLRLLANAQRQARRTIEVIRALGELHPHRVPAAGQGDGQAACLEKRALGPIVLNDLHPVDEQTGALQQAGRWLRGRTLAWLAAAGGRVPECALACGRRDAAAACSMHAHGCAQPSAQHSPASLQIPGMDPCRPQLLTSSEMRPKV